MAALSGLLWVSGTVEECTCACRGLKASADYKGLKLLALTHFDNYTKRLSVNGLLCILKGKHRHIIHGRSLVPSVTNP